VAIAAQRSASDQLETKSRQVCNIPPLPNRAGKRLRNRISQTLRSVWLAGSDPLLTSGSEDSTELRRRDRVLLADERKTGLNLFCSSLGFASATTIRLVHNRLEPNLQLQGFYQSSGPGGNEFNLINGQLTSPGGFGSSMSQLFGFGYPGCGGTLLRVRCCHRCSI
jgi:hypothetical protein